MARRTIVSDFQTALESIDKLLAKYSHKEDEWSRKSVGYHVSHAVEHGQKIIYAHRDAPPNNFNFEDLQSLACRALMALTMFLEESKKELE